MTLLFLHGIAQGGKSSSTLHKHWLEALNLGLSNSGLPALNKITSQKTIVPYYGDILARTKPDRQRRSAKASELDVDFTKFTIEFAAEVIGDPKKIADLKNSPNPSADRKKRDFQNWSPIIRITRGLDKRYAGISSAFIERFLKEVHSYLFDHTIQKTVDQIVKKALVPVDDPLIVISHSLGTVVAYNLLASSSKISAPLFVTLGSPLGINAVRERLRERPRMPAGVSEWFNGFDAKDIVALNPLDEEHFARTRPRIKNSAEIFNFTENHHSIAGYLAHPDVAKLIYESLHHM